MIVANMFVNGYKYSFPGYLLELVELLGMWILLLPILLVFTVKAKERKWIEAHM
ncbi:MAG: hypothetical protein ABJA67_13185 [Chthonomonadales bacterium]